jgi:hypothetical protein
MKKIVLFSFAIIGLMSTFVSCKKTTNGDTQTGNGDSMYITLSRSTVELNNFDYVAITVKDKKGNDLTSGCSFLLNNSTAINSKYIPSALGSFSITARKSGYTSNSATLNVVSKSASPFTQKILLEDCTGAWCGYCPRVAFDLEEYKATHPNCISLAVHGGSGTDPMKFQYYSNFNAHFNIAGYPTAILNRRSEWSEDPAELDVALQGWAPLGLAISSSVNGSSVSGTVKVKFNVNTYKSMKVVIALVENGYVYPQTNYYSPQYGVTPYLYGGVSPVNDFVHNGILRRTSTDLFGDVIPVDYETKDNVYEVPFTMSLSGNTSGGTYNAIADNCAIIAFVVDGSTGLNNAGAYNVQYAAVGTTKNFD